MNIKGIIDEDFVNYKLPSMFITTNTCSFKCDKECGKPICQNSALLKEPSIQINDEDLVKRYLKNPITKAIVFGGLEPIDQFEELDHCIYMFRNVLDLNTFKYLCYDDIVIYTGYTKEELENMYININFKEDSEGVIWPHYVSYLDCLKEYKNIVVKYGRFIPDQRPHFDPVLGVNLASDNQYAERIS